MSCTLACELGGLRTVRDRFAAFLVCGYAVCCSGAGPGREGRELESGEPLLQPHPATARAFPLPADTFVRRREVNEETGVTRSASPSSLCILCASRFEDRPSFLRNQTRNSYNARPCVRHTVRIRSRRHCRHLSLVLFGTLWPPKRATTWQLICYPRTFFLGL